MSSLLVGDERADLTASGVVPNDLEPVLAEGANEMRQILLLLVLRDDLCDNINSLVVKLGKFCSMSRLSRIDLGLDIVVGCLEGGAAIRAQLIELLLEILLDLAKLALERLLND